MHLKNISCFQKWILHKQGNSRKSVQLTSSGRQVKPTHVNLAGGCLFVPENEVNEFHARYLRYALIDKREINLTEQPMFCDDGHAYSPVIIDVDLRYDIEFIRWRMGDVQKAVEDWCLVMFKHLDVQTAMDELNVQVATCSDFPLRQDKDVIQADGSIVSEKIWKNGIHIYIPDIVADRRKLLEIRNSAYQAMGDRFLNTVNDSDSKIDSCIYKKNGILLAGSSKREQNRSAYVLTTTWKLTWTTSQGRLVFNFNEYPTSLVSKRDFLLKTILRVPSSDRRLLSVKIPVLLENEIACNEVNWDTK